MAGAIPKTSVGLAGSSGTPSVNPVVAPQDIITDLDVWHNFWTVAEVGPKGKSSAEVIQVRDTLLNSLRKPRLLSM